MRLLISVYSLVKKLAPATLALALTVNGGVARAERSLTLDEALRLARENNRDLKAARESLALAQATLEQVRAQLLPTVSANGRYTYNYPSAVLDPATFSAATDALAATLQATSADPIQQAALQAYRDQLRARAGEPITIVRENQLDFTAQAAVPLVVPGAYPAYQAARVQKKAAAATVEVSETAILYNTAALFYAAAGTEELVGARKHAIEVAAETVKNAKARLEAGVVNRVEVTRAELAYNRALQQHEEAKDQRTRAYRTLRTLVLLEEPFVVQPGERAAREEAVEELQRHALVLRPEVRAYELNIQAGNKLALSGWLRWLPSLSAFGRFGAGNYVGFSGKQFSFAAGVQADWLIYDGGVRDAARHQAEAQRRQAAMQLAQLRDTVNADIAQAAQELRTKREALRTNEKAVLLSKETLKLVRAQHDAGTATQLDLLQAQDALFSAEAGVAQARFDLALGELTLERNAGTFPANRGAMQ
jgi:outer membrane protein TolC